MTHLIVTSPNTAFWGECLWRCSSGKGGIKADKAEGDGATPVGFFTFRSVYYRPDRITLPSTLLPTYQITAKDGWCDDPLSPEYNKHIILPYSFRAEEMYRTDSLYDIVIVVGHNDAPPIPGKGSAIFIHLAQPEFTPTAGCIGLQIEHLCKILKEATLESTLVVLDSPLSQKDYDFLCKKKVPFWEFMSASPLKGI